MQDDIMWQVFTDTGDPLCWLMYRAQQDKENEKRRGVKPQSND